MCIQVKFDVLAEQLSKHPPYPICSGVLQLRRAAQLTANLWRFLDLLDKSVGGDSWRRTAAGGACCDASSEPLETEVRPRQSELTSHPTACQPPRWSIKHVCDDRCLPAGFFMFNLAKTNTLIDQIF